MIRVLRRWLLGVEPEGPPLLADPLYRYEARRYWTWRRYAGTALLLLGWLIGLYAYLRATAGGFSRTGPLSAGDLTMLTLTLCLLGRAPLSFVASTGAALCIVPERASGQFEQLILTPVDSWRFCLARLAGRLKGLFWIWAVLLAVPVALFLDLLFSTDWGRVTGQDAELAGGHLIAALIFLLMQVDLAAMLVVDAAVGMRFTATSSNTAMALIKTYLTNFALTPAAMYAGASAAGVACSSCVGSDGGAAFVVFAFLGRMVLAAFAIRLALRDARRAMDRAFYQPEDRA